MDALRYVFLLDCPLVLSLLKLRSVGYFGTRKKSGSNWKTFLNSSIEVP